MNNYECKRQDDCKIDNQEGCEGMFQKKTVESGLGSQKQTEQEFQFYVYQQIVMKLSYKYLLFLYSLFLLTHSQNLNITLPSFNCIIVYQKIVDNSLFLHHCESISSQNYSFSKTTWKDCIKPCCGLTLISYPNFNDESLRKCQEANIATEQDNHIITIITVVLSVIAVVTLIAAFLYKIVQLCSNKQVSPEIQQGNQIQTININKPIWIQMNDQKSHATLQNLERQQYNQCPICLEENINLVTPCMHRFHFSCLLAWFAKNKNCPLCKRTKIKELKIQCRYCQSKYVVLSINRAIKDVKQWLKFINVCDSCNVSPKVRARASTRDTTFGKLNCSKVQDDLQVIQL